MSSNNQPRRSSRTTAGKLPAKERQLNIVPEHSESDNDSIDSELEKTIVDEPDNMEEPTTAMTMEELLRQITELRSTLEQVSTNAAAEKAERIRLQEFVNQAQNTSTSVTTATTASISSAAANISTVPSTTTSVAAATVSIASRSVSLSEATTTSTPAMYSNFGWSNNSRYTMPLSVYQPATATSACTPCTHVVPTFLPPFSASQPCSQQFVPQQSTSPPPMNFPSSRFSQQFENTSHGNGRKLQDLPLFTGRPEEWPMFSTAFRESTIMFNYSKVENLFRLQKSIKQDAREVVESLLIHPENVDQVMSALEFRFGRPECLLRSQLAKVRTIPQISESKLEMLVPFATVVQNLSTFLEASGLHQHLANPTLIDELVGKLPMSKRLEWAHRSINIVPYPTIRHFAEWVTEVARFVCLVTSTSLLPSAQIEQKSGTKKVLHVSGQDAKAAPTRSKCRHCDKKQHSVSECDAFVKVDVPARWEFVKRNRLCFYCLKYGHSLRLCRVRKKCGIDDCPKMHHSLLHEAPIPTVAADAAVEAGCSKALLSCHVFANAKILFRVLPVRIYNDNIMVSTYALLDEGSSVTIMSADLRKQLRLNGRPKKLNLQWFGKETITTESFTLDVEISADREGAKRYSMHGIQTVDDLNLPSQTVNLEELRMSNCHLDIIPFAQYKDAKPQILIGLDNSHLGAPLRTLEPVGTGPIVAKTKLGWIIYGKTTSEAIAEPRDDVILHSSQRRSEHDALLDQAVEEYFALENFGIKKTTEQLVSSANKRAMKTLLTTTKKSNGRYQTGLLWKEDNPNVPDSYQMARRRLWNLESRLQKEPEYAETYNNIIKGYVEKGYARKLTAAEAETNTSKTWYLPHFGVRNPNKPNKVRLVFDAAAKVNDVSLNSFLLKGPDQLKPMMTILFNFRLRAVAVSGDIREMFHQIVIQPEDQNSQRFLWREHKGKPIDVYVMTSMTFGASCSPCSANYVKNLNASRYLNIYPRAARAIIDHHYVDDYVDSFDSEAEAIEVTNDVISIHREGGFELRNFSSNSKEVWRRISCLEPESQPNRIVELNIEAATEKILGMCWDPAEDIFKFQCKFPRVNREVMEEDRCPTKREFLSIAMSVFDPFGMVANFIIYIKLLLRSVWSHAVGWDEPVPQEIFERWQQWKTELPSLTQFRLPRCHDPCLTSATNIVLHTFVDASEEAYSAVSFLRIEIDGSVRVSFILGKTKCAPKKLISIPRLELCAAILGVRLCNTIVENHDLRFSDRVFWTDSKNVISWIGSEPRRYKQFVGFRIAEILENSQVNQWRWVPSRLNPADEATRARYPPKLNFEGKWIRGPEFLSLPETDWPLQPDVDNGGACASEVRPRFLLHANAVSSTVVDMFRFSKYSKLLRCVAWVLRFKDVCLRKRTVNGELCVGELEAAERILCQQAQREVFAHEISRLSQGLSLEKSSNLFKLTPYIDDAGLLRVYGRIDAATTIPFTARRPIILPKDHRLTRLIVDHFHCRLRHQNDDTIANQIRLRFWVPSLRPAVRRAKNDCLCCRIRSAKPQPPLMGQLPEDRLTPNVRPFTYTGLDYFGPVYITIGRRREKRWIALFTCMTVRAVHLEIAENLSSDACVLCIRNFINRRGIPKRIRSDNGTNFIGAKKELLGADIFDNEAIKAELSSKGIEWSFNCPSNPHAGGCWERLVQSVKRVLSHTLSEIAPRFGTLQSAIIEAENIINGRPLTHLPVSSEDEDPLTPNHFLLGVPNSTHTPGKIDERALCLRKQWRISQQLKDRIWKRWIHEYLPVLTRRCKWFQRVEPLKVGDLCLVCDSNVPRSQWMRGRITRVFPGQDGQIRMAEVKTSTGIFRRPAVKIAVLDVGEALGPERLTGVGMSLNILK